MAGVPISSNRREIVASDIASSTAAAMRSTIGRGRLLAFSDDKAREAHLARTPLTACTPRTVTDQKRLRAVLRQVRAGGIAFSEDEHVLGSTGIAAPVFDRNARIVAALDIGAIWPAAGLVDAWIRFSPDRRPLDGTQDIQPRVQGRGG